MKFLKNIFKKKIPIKPLEEILKEDTEKLLRPSHEEFVRVCEEYKNEFDDKYRTMKLIEYFGNQDKLSVIELLKRHFSAEWKRGIHYEDDKTVLNLSDLSKDAIVADIYLGYINIQQIRERIKQYPENKKTIKNDCYLEAKDRVMSHINQNKKPGPVLAFYQSCIDEYQRTKSVERLW